MEVTIKNSDQKTKRTCPNCSKLIEEGNAKRQYCSEKCKVAHHRRKQIQAIQLTEQIVKQKEDRIQELETRPVKQKSSVQVPNPAWKLAYQSCTVQTNICLGLEAQLKDLKLEEREMTSRSKGAFYGATIGVGFSLFWIAALYDDRQDKKLGTAFLVGSILMLLVIGLIGYWIGQILHAHLIFNNEQINMVIAENSQKRDELERQLRVGKQDLLRLQNRLAQINQYDSEVITTVEDIRV